MSIETVLKEVHFRGLSIISHSCVTKTTVFLTLRETRYSMPLATWNAQQSRSCEHTGMMEPVWSLPYLTRQTGCSELPLLSKHSSGSPVKHRAMYVYFWHIWYFNTLTSSVTCVVQFPSSPLFLLFRPLYVYSLAQVCTLAWTASQPENCS
jgi:hypothetical protein